MGDQITNYKCPACGGPLHFAAGSGMMECEYCESTFSVAEIESKYADANAGAEAAKAEADSAKSAKDEWEVTTEEWIDEGMKAYECPSCGATLLCDENYGSSSCPYCGNPTIVPGQFAGTLKPDYVLPFKITKDEAVNKLKEFYGKKYLVPKSFKDFSHLEEAKGVYVPFWLYDGYAKGDCRYTGIKKHVERKGDEEIITSKYYLVERSGEERFEKIPTDASSKMDDSMMDSIEPYDYKDLKPFTKAYLTGFLSDKYDVSAEEDSVRAMKRAKQSMKDALRDDVKGYDIVNPKKEDIFVKQGKAYYSLMPVWMLTTGYNGKNYMFAMNGQTGKAAGELPMDKPKFVITLLIEFIALFAAAFFLTDFALVAKIVVPAVITLITAFVLKGTLNNVSARLEASHYVADNSLKITGRTDRFLRQTVERRKLNNNSQSN